jgi:putative ABC transport system ATP-binding protein
VNRGRVAAAGITLDRVAKQYETPGGIVDALRGVDLRVTPGSSLAIMGPSGCGKSTLLGLIAGLETPTTGRVVVGAAELSEMPEEERATVRRRELGLVFQAGNLLPFLTVLENVSLGLALTGSVGAYRRSAEMLDGLGLGDDLEKLPDQLSGGMRQRVALARALIHRPRLILADEPTGSLDADNSAVVLDLLLAAERRERATLVVVTHDPAVASRFDRTLHLRDGRIDA